MIDMKASIIESLSLFMLSSLSKFYGGFTVIVHAENRHLIVSSRYC
jgi:hypothetical protein